MKKGVKVAIIGGGIAGSTVAVALAKLGLNISLFEKNDTLVSGPPICHLHAGGNLYREISDDDCVVLLRESIEMLRFYPDAIDYRPTVLAIPNGDDGKPKDLYPRLNLLKNEYEKLISKDPQNKVLSSSKNYFKLYEKEEVEYLRNQKTVQHPKTLDEWLIPFTKNTNLDNLKFPVIVVQEYGLNIFRLSSTASLACEGMDNAKIFFSSTVLDIKSLDNRYEIEYEKSAKRHKESFDYVINATGFRTGSIDDMLDIKRDSLVEFKSAYVTKWQECDSLWPEVIFFGKRGTPQGMGQFTPYPNGYFQLHGMTEDITLFEDGLVKNEPTSSQPKLAKKFIDKIEKGWSKEEIESRTKKAIAHIQQYIPSYKEVEIASKPLYGAQQIPSLESSLRTANVSFDKERYARCEIVKGNSVINMSRLIIDDMIKLGYLDKDTKQSQYYLKTPKIPKAHITTKAQEICKSRGYPVDMASINIGREDYLK